MVQQLGNTLSMATQWSDAIYLKPLPYQMYADYPVIKKQLTQLWNFETKHPSIAYYQSLDPVSPRTRLALFNLPHSLVPTAINTATAHLIYANRALSRISASSLLTNTKIQITGVGSEWLYLNHGLVNKKSTQAIAAETSGLKPVHELLSIAHTSSFATSVQLAQQICNEIWLVKSKGDITQLPVQLKKVYDFASPQHELPGHEDHVRSQLTIATDILVELSRHFSQFEAHATTLLTLLKNNIWQSDTVQRYQLLCQKIAGHQFSSDHIPLYQVYQPDSAIEAFARVWDAYSSALGITETMAAYRLAQYDKQQLGRSENLELAWHAFTISYSWGVIK